MNRVIFAFLAAAAVFTAGSLQAADSSFFGTTLLSLDPSETPASMQVVAYLAKAERGGKTPSPAVNPDGGFIDNGDGSVTDTRTGLVWLKDAGHRVLSRH